MSADTIELQIAATPVRDHIPNGKPLPERVSFAMRYVREHERDLFWMTARTTDDLMMRTALAAVLMAGDDSDRDVIKRSLKPLQMLSAAMSGIPVDFGAMEMSDDLIPLMKLWDESKGSEPK